MTINEPVSDAYGETYHSYQRAGEHRPLYAYIDFPDVEGGHRQTLHCWMPLTTARGSE